jgi:hypothetical protein
MDFAGFDSIVDHLKFVAARLDQVQGELNSDAASESAAIDVALHGLG